MIGQIVSHFKILEKLGQGGMGVVYKAHDARLDRDVALKFLPAEFSASPEDLARFEQEAKAISTLNYPSIATIYDFDEINDQRFLVLEYIPGGTLKTKIKKLQSEDRELPITDVIEYGIQMADGLAHAHRHHIIHRDIKSDNIMLTEDGKVKITDFGLAKLRGATHITHSGSTLGTLGYMAPEQLRGEEIDGRADLFSLGVVLYEMATGRTPFRGEHEAALMYSIANEEPVPIKILRENLPLELDHIIAKTLQKDPEHRYQRAEDMAADLRKLQQEVTGTVKTVVVNKRSKLPWLIGAAILVLGAVGVYFFLPASRPGGANAKTIAVLPFVNLTGIQGEEYFSDGITDEILTDLAQIADLNVISRTSTMQFKGTTKTIREIGKELNAGAILEGSVLHVGNQVRVTAQLIDATNDKHLWAQTYNREFKEVLTIQSELAEKIATTLEAKLSPAETRRMTAVNGENPEVYNLLLEAKYFYNYGDSASVIKSVELYRQALRIDSTDARAWAGLAISLVGYVSVGLPNLESANVEARRAALRSVALGDSLGAGHRILGYIYAMIDWDWEKGDREFKRALELEPGASASYGYGSYLASALGRFDEAIALCNKAIALDPVSYSLYSSLALNYYMAGRYSEAIAAQRRALELSPSYLSGRMQLGMNYLFKGNIDSALANMEQEQGMAWREFGLSVGYYAAGRTRDADRMLEELIRVYAHEAAFQIAEAYSYRNEPDKAFAWLDTAYNVHDPGMTNLLGDPLLKNINKDARFKAISKKMKLDDLQR